MTTNNVGLNILYEEEIKVIDLNDVAKISELDSKDSLITTENYDMQFKEGLSLAENFKIGKSVCDFDELVILGTGGGSSVSGGLLDLIYLMS